MDENKPGQSLLGSKGTPPRAAARQNVAGFAVEREANLSHASTDRRVPIVIEESRDATDSQDVFVQVNGRAYLYKRGVEVIVPPEVIEVLNNAVIEKMVRIDEGNYVMRPVKRFPFRILGEAV